MAAFLGGSNWSQTTGAPSISRRPKASKSGLSSSSNGQLFESVRMYSFFNQITPSLNNNSIIFLELKNVYLFFRLSGKLSNRFCALTTPLVW